MRYQETAGRRWSFLEICCQSPNDAVQKAVTNQYLFRNEGQRMKGLNDMVLSAKQLCHLQPVATLRMTASILCASGLQIYLQTIVVILYIAF